MKELTTGIAIGALVAGLGTFLVVKNTSPEASEPGQSLFADQQSSSASGKHRATGSHSSSRSPSGSPSSGTSSASVASIMDYSNATSTSEQLQLVNRIFTLDLGQIQELLASPDIKSINHFDQSGIAVLNAAFARLTEISPTLAQEELARMTGTQKYVAAASVYKEWALKDLDTALAMAEEETDPQIKQAAMSGVLAELSKTDPNKAFDLAKKGNNQRAYYAIMVNWSKTDPAAAFEKSKEMGQQGTWVRQTILSNWATREPDVALKFAKDLPTKTAQGEAILGIIQSTLANDEDKAYQMLDDNSDIIKDQQLYSIAYQLGQKDPQRALAWLETRPTTDNRSRITGQIIQQWVQNDEPAAMAYYEGLDDAAAKRKIGKAILQNLTHSNPEKFFKLSQTIKMDKNDREWMTQSAVSSLVKTDPDKAKDYVNALTDKAARKSAIDGLISGLAQEDPQLAIDFAEQLTDPVEKKAALGEAYEDMANKDPAAVAELFLSQKINKVGDFDLGDLVYRYARKDLDGARDLVDRIEDPIHRDKAIGRLISQWSSEDPAAALAYTREQPVTSGIESAMYTVGRKLGETDPQTGLAEGLTLPKGSARNNFLYSLFDEWAENDIESAISALPILHQQDPKKSHERLYGQIATEYVDQPEKATQWLGTIENAKDRNTATRNFVTGWAKDEPNKAADWVNTIQDTGQRDAAVRSLVNTFDNTEPSYALEWATSLSDNKTRASDVTRTYNKWKKRDPNGAQQWLNSTQLIGESLKEKLAK